jgi:hypothetical protein
MPINLNDNEILLRCACGASDHIALLTHDADDPRDCNLKGVEDDWYLSVMLDHFRFWKRLRLAARYLFAPQTIKYGMAAELVLRNEDVEKLAHFILTRQFAKAIGAANATIKASAALRDAATGMRGATLVVDNERSPPPPSC